MRRLVVNAFVSLDGVMQAPGGPDEDPVGGFTHGGWAVNYWDEAMMARVAKADPYELLLGRGTYEIFAAATGVTISTYERAGAIRPGSTEFDEPTEAEIERRRRLDSTAS
jgi:dihydrofolate reductase